MSGTMRLSDVVNAASAPSVAASLRKYGYDGPSADADAVARWLRAQAPDIDTEVGAPAGAAAREARPDQRRFRRAVLDAYGGRCAVTGCNVAEALEAAHVADWRSENDVGAGLLLRVDLHRLLERGCSSSTATGRCAQRPRGTARSSDGACACRPIACTGRALRRTRGAQRSRAPSVEHIHRTGTTTPIAPL